MASVPRHPDVLLIVLDTLRADHLSCYGYPRPTSPNLDAFAEGGVLFERAISPAQWTIPAHASLFSGEYPSTHLTAQIHDRHSTELISLAGTLREQGYQTVGFCNNPLLGVVDNGLDRGFEAFYNYGGTVPNRPEIGEARPSLVKRAGMRLAGAWRRLLMPIQDRFARSEFLLKLALNPTIARLWSGRINFKGNTALSLRDLVGCLQTRLKHGRERPLFAFVNLMETHLPYLPRPRFIHQFAPYWRDDAEARTFMRSYNGQHYRWMVPMEEPLPELEDRVLNDLYDAEIAFQDHLMRRLFAYLAQPEVRDSTMVIILSDHGEGLNHHGFVGHSMVAYDDLLHVPMTVRYPPLYPANVRISQPVGSRRVFHTILDAVGIEPPSNGRAADGDGAPVDVASLSLRAAVEANGHNGDHPDIESGGVLAEAYPPDTLIHLMEAQDPDAIDVWRCRAMRRAIYRDNCKLITVDDQPDELFDTTADPEETSNRLDDHADVGDELHALLAEMVEQATLRRPATWAREQLRIQEDQALQERLRGLGYIE
ncbi:MAG: sulfatase [Anaerolineae bacterium]